jgi:hypothetical protein
MDGVGFDYIPGDSLAVSYRLVRFALTFLPLSNQLKSYVVIMENLR